MNKYYLSRVMKTTLFFLLGGMLTVSASSYSQQITLTGKNIPFPTVVEAIRKQSGYTVFSTKNVLESAPAITIEARKMNLTDFLHVITADQAIDFQVAGKTISFVERNSPVSTKAITSRVVEEQQQRTITGQITDADTKNPLAGVTVRLKGQKNSVLSDNKGNYSISFPADLSQPTLVFSFIGMKTVEYTLKNSNSLNINLESEAENIKDAVVTGIYQRKKESFSGSASTYTAKELKMIGNQNVLQSLKTLDPSFAIVDNNLFGSDPNKLPDIEIRGKSSVVGLTEKFGSNPNQPLFILDGFESSLAVISDLSMDRIESITILKDAAATAIYGSKAANGVVVVETKRPLPGQLRLSYNFNSSLSFADLRDYNLMNAEEKLNYERLSFFYGSLDANGNILDENNELKYFNRMKEVARGVNTYWANEPLRTGFYQRHNVFVEGGDQNLRYSGTLNYANTEGVMKGSSRTVTNGNVRIIYRKNNISFSNSLSIDHVTANMEAVSFSKFVRANPYHRKYNEFGGLNKMLESFQYLDIGTFSMQSINIYNPLFDMSNNNLNQTTHQGFTNNFEFEWRIDNALRFRTRLGINQVSGRAELFRSPFNSEFVGAPLSKQGLYTEDNGKQHNYDGDISLTYGKLLNQKHMINIVGGMRFNQTTALNSGYLIKGFIDDDFRNPTFSLGFENSDKPSYRDAKRRSASIFLNTGYAYDGRYLVDATIRSDASSVYGSDKQSTLIWSTGLAWNMHNESFLKDASLDWLNLLKIRGSIGNPGNQNFDDYISMRVYRYNNENRNPFGSSVILNNFGNSGLKWQKTLDKNIGIDLELFKNRLRFNVDYFRKDTDPLLVYVNLPTSTGTSAVAKNVGSLLTKGITLLADYSLIRKENFTWRINLNMRHIKSEYRNIGNSLEEFNKNNKSRNLVRYYDHASPSDLWAVRSLGIDPATGREVFLTKDNQQTFVHSYDNEVVVGNSDPKLDGIIGTNFYYKGFTGSIFLRYRLGGQTFMQTLYDKVENVTMQNIALNQDKRALYDRWKNPGDIAKFKAISQTDYTPISSRFVEKNNILAGESISFGYETFGKPWLKKIGASSIDARIYMNDIFRFSTIKNERGLDYPFARTVSFSLGLRF